VKTPQLLSQLQTAHEARISGFTPELPDDFRVRLQELGFREGTFVRCLRKTPLGGPHVFEINGAVFSLESSVAQKVLLHV